MSTGSCERNNLSDLGVLNGKSFISKIPMTHTQSMPSRSNSRLTLSRNISYGNMLAPSTRTEAKVLVIYTGGTIGMMRNQKGGKSI